jgi:large subunit ribosomal protein L30
MTSTVKITQVKSSIDRPKKQKATLKALGLNRISQVVLHDTTPQIEGMIRVVDHLISVEYIKK